MDIFNWPFPSPTPPLIDRSDIVKMENVVDAAVLFGQAVDNSTLYPVDNSTTPNMTTGEEN